jgi:DNA polymerase bacteriophage-type
MQVFKTDFETRGLPDIGGADGVGLFNYFNHPETRILMQAYKLPGDDGPCRRLWEPHINPVLPQEIRDAYEDPNIMIEAFNSAFERNCIRFHQGFIIPPERFVDPQIGGRYLCLPADLESMCDILGVPQHLAKDKRGAELIKLFCIPKVERKSKKNPNPRTYFNDWNSHPAEWNIFRAYCMRDVDAEENLLHRETILGAWPMSDFERAVWCFDQRVNDRGMPVDTEFVECALWIAKKAKRDALASQNELTGLDNSNSTQQLLPWVRERGYPYNTLNKAFVEAALNDPQYTIEPVCRQVLQKRLSAGSTSYTKLEAIKRIVAPDGRARNMFIYLGSSRCGRWSGNAVQPHNFPRPSKPKDVNGADFEDEDTLVEARDLIYRRDYEGILAKYGNVLEVIKSTLRTAFVAPGTVQHT